MNAFLWTVFIAGVINIICVVSAAFFNVLQPEIAPATRMIDFAYTTVMALWALWLIASRS